MNEVEIVVRPTGHAVSMYKDERKDLFEALGKMRVQRASNVEWEDDGLYAGWVVRAAHDPELAIRAVIKDGAYRRIVGREGGLLHYTTREAALEVEQKHFWELLPAGARP